jgi:hypothetical protein
MPDARLLSRGELERRLSPYRCEKVRDIAPGFEIWQTGWGVPFTLCTRNGHYDEFDYQRIVEHVISERALPTGTNKRSD